MGKRNPEVSIFEMERLKKIFDSFAVEDEEMDKAKFIALLKRIMQINDEYDFPVRRFDLLWASIDEDQSGSVSFPEFLKWWIQTFKKNGPVMLGAVSTVQLPNNDWSWNRITEIAMRC